MSDLSAEYDSGFFGIIPPTYVYATDGTYYDKVVITWQEVDSVERYHLFRAESIYGTYSEIGTKTNSGFEDTTASFKTNYYYKVKSFSTNYGYSSFSTYNSGYRDLDAPDDVEASDGTYSDKIRVSYDSVSQAAAYYIYRSTAEYGTYTNIVNTTYTNYDDTYISVNTNLYYKVKAYVAGYYSDFSEIDSGYISTN